MKMAQENKVRKRKWITPKASEEPSDDLLVEINNEGDSEDEELEFEEVGEVEDPGILYSDNDDDDDDNSSESDDEGPLIEDSESSASDTEEDKTSPLNKSKSKSKPTSEQSTSFTTPRNPPPEYEVDTSDEEDIRNTVGNIPMNWYDDYDHIGYDWDGEKIMKPNKGDNIDNLLKKMEDPNFYRTVRDLQTGQDVVLSDKDVDLIERLQKHKIPDPDFDNFAPWVEWFTSEVMEMPLRKFPEHKRSFTVSKDEMKKVAKYAHAIKMGWMKTRKQLEEEKQKAKEDRLKFYMLWKSDDAGEEMRRIHAHIPAPKRPLPDHSESYNPPEEYLFNKTELKKWEKERKSLGGKKLHFVPQKYSSLRLVPAYSRFTIERFRRCLDLYMCPRAMKMKLTIEPEDLVPQLPDPKDLQPFPSVLSLTYKGHTDMVRSISLDPSGQYLASSSDDCTVKIWEVSTARCLKTIPVGGVGRSIAWCPNQAVCLLAVAADKEVLVINPGVGDNLVVSKTDAVMEEPPGEDETTPERVKTAAWWEAPSESQWKDGIRMLIHHFKEVKQVSWHGKGDYLATVMPEGANRAVIIHQLSKRKSQLPFSKPKGLVQAVLFHPIRPFFFVATQRNIRIYDLVKQEMVKKLYSNSQWISSMAIHPGGDNLLVGTYDRKTLWFDLDLSTRPYKSLRLHGNAVRGVSFHKRYPLFASGSDDRSVIVSHGMVYNDLLQNALIVPLKRLSHHQPVNDFSVLDVVFHPVQPWVLSCGADATVRLYS